MASMSIHVSDELRSRLEARAASEGFGTVESYIQAMLVADAAGPVIEDDRLESLLSDRVDGPFVDADAADFRQMREKLQKRLDVEDRRQGPRP